MEPIKLFASCSLLMLSCAAPLAALAQASVLPPVMQGASRASASTASAATAARAAVVQVVDDDAHGAFKEAGFTGCSQAGPCTLTYTPTASARRRLVQHLNCFATVGSGGSLRYVAFLASSYTAPRHFLPISRSPSSAASTTYFVDAVISFPFETGESPMVYAYADGAPIQDLECTITGRDIALP